MVTIILYYLFLLVITIKKIETYEEYEKCNFSFYCSSYPQKEFCLYKQKTNADDIFDIILNYDFDNSFTCDVNQAFATETETSVVSRNKSKIFLRPSYINGSCYNSLQCLIGICQDNKCVAYSKCISHEQCPLNTFCSEGNCIPLLDDNSTCNNSYQCKFNSFCNNKKKCTKLFSVDDNTDINYLNETHNYYTNLDEVCKSGGYLKSYGSLKCQTLYNVNYQCDNDKCKYKYNSSKKKDDSVSIKESCLCGYNRYRKKNCKLGNGEKEYIDFLNIRKEFLFNEDYIKKCHTLERDYKEICNELINTDKSVYFRNFVKNYNNLKIKALEFHRLKDSDPCVKTVVFGYDTNPVISDNQKCPKYSCDSSLPVCLIGKNPFNERGDGIEISLNSEICSVNESCVLSSNTNSITQKDILQIMSKEQIVGTCSIYSYWPSVRYPGEDCNINSDCISDFECLNGKCSGFSEGENCTHTQECKVGFYCNKDLMKCTSQKNEGEICVEGWDCQNYLGCYKGRCRKLGIIKPGVINNEITSPFPGNDRRDLLCTTGDLDRELGYCVETKYNEEWMRNKGKTEDEKGFIKCEYKEKCFYDNGKNIIEKECGCGYNSNGQGYCPLPSSKNPEKWNERVKNLANFAKNDCHSLSRFDCYLQNSIEDMINKRKYDKETINAHLFYDGLPCALKMFSFHKYVKVNFLILLILCLILKY